MLHVTRRNPVSQTFIRTSVIEKKIHILYIQYTQYIVYTVYLRQSQKPGERTPSQSHNSVSITNKNPLIFLEIIENGSSELVDYVFCSIKVIHRWLSVHQ